MSSAPELWGLPPAAAEVGSSHPLARPTLQPPVHPEGLIPAAFCSGGMQHSRPRLWISTNAKSCQECCRTHVFSKLCCPTSDSDSSSQQCSPATAPTTVLHPELVTAGKPGSQGTEFKPETNLKCDKQVWIKQLTPPTITVPLIGRDMIELIHSQLASPHKVLTEINLGTIISNRPLQMVAVL